MDGGEVSMEYSTEFLREEAPGADDEFKFDTEKVYDYERTK